MQHLFIFMVKIYFKKQKTTLFIGGQWYNVVSLKGGAEVEQTIYADILFAVNFSMDFFALYVTNFMLKLRFSLKRCIISAILGALYGVVSVVTELGFAVGLLATATVGTVMCIILNGYSGIKLLVKEITVFL